MRCAPVIRTGDLTQQGGSPRLSSSNPSTAMSATCLDDIRATATPFEDLFDSDAMRHDIGMMVPGRTAASSSELP